MSGVIVPTVEMLTEAKKSPFWQGVEAGGKAALLGGPIVGFVQAMRNKSPLLGALAGAFAIGTTVGLGKAVAQQMENIEQESALRYYAQNLKSREPFLFMPPPNLMDRLVAATKPKESPAPAPKPLRILHVPTQGIPTNVF